MNHHTRTANNAANAEQFAHLAVLPDAPIDDVDAAELHWLAHGDARHYV